MRVAVTMRAVVDERTGEARECISRDVLRWLERWDAEPVLVPSAMADAGELARRMDVRALLLTGGNDLCGMGQSADALRDQAELALLRQATEARWPVLGICRGMQVIARFAGCAVEAIEPRGNHAGTTHEIEVNWAAIDEAAHVGEHGQRVMTNSFHDFGVRMASLPPVAQALAWSADGYVEALRHRELPMIGVQWHPERAGSAAAVDDAIVRKWLQWSSAAAEACSR